MSLANLVIDELIYKIKEGINMAEIDNAYGLSDSLYEVAEFLDEVVAKYKKVLGVEDSHILTEITNTLDEIAEDYETPEMEIIEPSQDLTIPKVEIIDAEIVK